MRMTTFGYALSGPFDDLRTTRISAPLVLCERSIIVTSASTVYRCVQKNVYSLYRYKVLCAIPNFVKGFVMDAMPPSCQFRLDEGVKLTLDSDKVTERFKSCAVVVCAEQIGIIKVVKRIEARKRGHRQMRQ